MNRNSGIYKITNRVSGKVYIGSSLRPKSRWIQHLCNLRKGEHHSKKLQNSWNKNKETDFHFEIVLLCAPENLAMYEQIFLDFYNSSVNGYNILPTAGTHRDAKRSEETKRRISESARNRATPEYRAKLSAIFKSATTDEKRGKCALSRKGKTLSDEAKAKISAARKGKTLSAEHRAKMSESHKANWERKRKEMEGRKDD